MQRRRCLIDKIVLTGLEAKGFHGVFPDERRVGQRFIADICLELELDTASDELANTINYVEIATIAEEELTGSPCNLIETVAGRIAQRCLSYGGVQVVTVTVHKPQAPLEQTFADVSVTITRSK